MNREEVREELLKLSVKYKNMLIQLPTGFGKTVQGLSIMKKYVNKDSKILIVIPRNVLIQSWKDEIKKWNMEGYNYAFTTYVSLPKHAGKWDVVIFDECHHLSERCREALASFTINRSILLSATVKYTLADELKEVFDNLYSYKVKIREAIENEILPDPKIYLVPLELQSGIPTEVIYKNPKAKGEPIITSWANRWPFMRNKEYPIHIYCNQIQYHEDLCSQIEWYKNKYMRTRNEVFKNRWLKLAGDRLKWLAKVKNNTIKEILNILDNERTLVFCADINQTEELGDNCINSKNKESLSILEDFNKGIINHITSCNILNEGMNLCNCRIGIYANLNSSETIVSQRMGRILRHKDPIIIIPYFKNTREEELVLKMMENYNNDLVYTIKEKEIKNLKL